MEELIIKIGTREALTILISGFISLIGIVWFFGRKFGKFEGSLTGFDTRLTNIESTLSGLITSSSPISLTEKGTKILNESGLKKYIDDNKDYLINDCRKYHDTKSPYDVQVSTFMYFDKIKFPKDLENRLKEFAFREGINMDIMRRMGGIYFRDVCLDYLGMEIKDVDIPKPIS